MQKVLLVVLAVSGLVLLGEGAYYLWYRPSTTTVQTSPLPTISAPVHTSPTIYTTPTPLADAVIDTETVANFSHVPKGLVYSSIVVNEYRGQLAELQNTSTHPLIIRLIDKNGQGDSIFLSQEQLAKTQFFKLDSKNQEVAMDRKELKVNDTVAFSDTIDLTKSATNKLIRAKIVKLK